MYCFVILLLFNEMQMSVRRFSAIPHLRVHTAPHLTFDKFHHNKRIALKRQRCILGSCAYLCSFSWVPDPILSRRKPLLNMKLAFPGMRFHLKCTHESLRAAWTISGQLWTISEIVHKQKRHCGVQRGRFDGNRNLSARPWNVVASLDATSTL